MASFRGGFLLLGKSARQTILRKQSVGIIKLEGIGILDK
jgi:hypothetical protein